MTVMRYFDTHCHFSDGDDIRAILGRAADAGVVQVLAVGGSDELNRNALRSPCRVAVGLDRDQIDDIPARLDAISSLIADNRERVAAIGEIGLDFHYSPETEPQQRELFAMQLDMAAALGLPVVVHTRDADAATLETIDSVPARDSGRLRGVIHSYTGDRNFARALLDRGFAISFSGIATFRSAENVRESVRYVPDDRILAETDSPFLAPVPLRGRPCEPAFIVHTVRCLAMERGTPLDIFSEILFANSQALFG